MVLESNRELVLRRLLECLGRDRTKHQVAEVTSLGLVQMTRKRVGQGLLEVFSETCECCGGRGIIVHDEPVEKRPGGDAGAGAAGRRARRVRRRAGPGRVERRRRAVVPLDGVGPGRVRRGRRRAHGHRDGDPRSRRRRGGGRSAAVAEGA